MKSLCKLLIFCALFCPTLKEDVTFSGRVEKYVLSNKEKIDAEIEKKFNIKLGKADYKLAKLKDYESGKYYEGYHTVYINQKQKNFSEFEFNQINRQKYLEASSLKGIMIHERIHEYTDEISEKLGNQKKFSLFEQKTETRFLLEGIAQYAKIMFGEGKFMKLQEKDKIPGSNNFFYKYSFYYLYPLLDSLGLEQGIKTILTNDLVTKEEIQNMELYYERIFNKQSSNTTDF